MASPRSKDPDGNLADLQALSASERACLGCALWSTAAGQQIAASLRREDFNQEAHRKVFDAIISLVERGVPVDQITLAEQLRSQGRLEAAGGTDYINQIQESVPTAAHVEHYIGSIVAASVDRMARSVGASVPSILDNSDDKLVALTDIVHRFEALAARPASAARRIFSAPELMAEDLPLPTFTVPGLLPEGLMLLIGKQKQGKSWLAYQIAVAIATGGMALGAIPVTQSRVLYLALEDTKRRLKNRLLAISGNSAAPELLDLAVTWKRADNGGLAELDAYCRRCRDTKLIIIDVFGKFRPVREKSAAGVYLDDYHDVGGLKEVADRYGCTVLLIHHQNKSRVDDIADSISGSTGIGGAADGWLILKRERSQTFASLVISGRDLEERELALEWDPRTIWTLRGDAGAYAQTREEDEVLETLRRHGYPMRPKEVGDTIGIPRDTAQKRLARMQTRGVLVVDRAGYYYLAAGQGAPTPEKPPFQFVGVGAGVGGVDGVAVGATTRKDTDPAADTDDSDELKSLFSGEEGPRACPILALPDPAPDAAEAELRRHAFRLGWERSFESLDVGSGMLIEAGHDAWAHACSTWPFDPWLIRALNQLDGHTP